MEEEAEATTNPQILALARAMEAEATHQPHPVREGAEEEAIVGEQGISAPRPPPHVASLGRQASRA